jgi:hypothetical protein
MTSAIIPIESCESFHSVLPIKLLDSDADDDDDDDAISSDPSSDTSRPMAVAAAADGCSRSVTRAISSCA